MLVEVLLLSWPQCPAVDQVPSPSAPAHARWACLYEKGFWLLKVAVKALEKATKWTASEFGVQAPSSVCRLRIYKPKVELLLFLSHAVVVLKISPNPSPT